MRQPDRRNDMAKESHDVFPYSKKENPGWSMKINEKKKI